MNPPIPGRRHNSFFALGIVAYKCRREVPYEEALETIPMVYEDMMDETHPKNCVIILPPPQSQI